MCGIAGLLDLSRRTGPDELAAIADAMAAAVRHRGPDGEGVWIDPACGIGLAHRRLSIIDVSGAGAQPMESRSARYVITYNGEIYNANELRTELIGAGCNFRGHSDTEVLVEAIDAWGLEKALTRSNGMFAFALWDRRERKLHLVRDRLGEKPLYFAWLGDTLAFGSELRALKAHPSFKGEIDRDALALLLRVGCIPAPHSIFAGVHKLMPATILTVDPERDVGVTTSSTFWSAPNAFGSETYSTASDAELVEELDHLLGDAVKIRMRSDVPLGAFLSGGIDSSAVVGLMQEVGNAPVKTFTIANTVATLDESERAASVARALGTQHTELVVSSADALDIVPRLPEIYDEPFADSAQIPGVLVAKLARRRVTVSLSGDGGDELFGGYDRYRWINWMSSVAPRVPGWIRRGVARGVDAVRPAFWEGAARAIPGHLRPRIPSTKVAKLAAISAADSARDMYERVISDCVSPETIVIGAEAAPAPWTGSWAAQQDALTNMMLADVTGYLPDDILTKLDRSTMSVGLEGRVPLLDHRVVEFAASLPLRHKIRDGQGKWILRRVLERHVPLGDDRSPKSGFGVPIGSWLREPLREWAEDLLAAARLQREGFLDPEPIRELWDEHLRGHEREYQLWNVLMFQAWLDAQGSRPSRTTNFELADVSQDGWEHG